MLSVRTADASRWRTLEELSGRKVATLSGTIAHDILLQSARQESNRAPLTSQRAEEPLYLPSRESASRAWLRWMKRCQLIATGHRRLRARGSAPAAQTIEESIAADLALLGEWSNNDKNYIVNELLRFALSQDSEFQAYKESGGSSRPRNKSVRDDSPRAATSSIGGQGRAKHDRVWLRPSDIGEATWSHS